MEPRAPTRDEADHAAAAASVRYVLGRLRLVEHRVSREIARLRELAGGADSDSNPGFYASHPHVDRVLAEAGGVGPLPIDEEAVAYRRHLEARADEDVEAGADVRLRSLVDRMGLSELDVELLLVAAAPAVDERFEALYAHLNDDRSRRYATVGTAVRLCGVGAALPDVRDRLGPAGRLVRGGLLRVVARTRPFTAAELRVRDRAVRHILGSDVVDEALAPLLVDPAPVSSATSARLASAFAAGQRAAYVRDAAGVGGASSAAGALAACGLATVMLDLGALAPDAEVAVLARAAACEAHLQGAGLVVGPVEVLAARGLAAVHAFTDLDVPLVLVGRAPWDPEWARRAVVSVAAERIDPDEQHRLWRESLGSSDEVAAQVARWTSSFRLTPQQIQRAAASAQHHAAAEARAITRDDVHRGVRGQNASGLERLARRVEARVSWDDIVVPARIEHQLREIPMRWRNRDRVLQDWGMGRGVATGRGVSALFAGASGTGKTLAAEVIAGELGLDLYVVDLSTVVDKYIGETSKNLERIFEQADRVNGVLLFDEADALFGKRSAVSDAKDRHANVEVAFLLQRMESFDGVAILTTNLAGNLDDAFLRRLDTIVDFPAPTDEQQRAIWKVKLERGAPIADDVDIDRLATMFTLSGAEIGNVVVSAAYWASDRDESVTMHDLVLATIREHRKVGRHLTAGELGEFAGLLRT